MMTTTRLLLATWDFEPSIVIGCAALMVVYLVFTPRRRSRWTVYYTAGVAVMFLALVSPVDSLGDDYLFSAHMIQHLLLVLAAPPLMIIGLPEEMVRRWMNVRFVREAEARLRRPTPAWILGIGTLWIWHLPYLYNLTLASEGIHIFEHLTFIVTGTIFWWPIYSPLPSSRMPLTKAMIYLLFAAGANTLLGILLTFAPLGLYPKYLHPEPGPELELIRRGWGVTAADDQELGGLFMWVLGGFVFFGVLMQLFARWYRQPEEEIRPPETHASHPTTG